MLMGVAATCLFPCSVIASFREAKGRRIISSTPFRITSVFFLLFSRKTACPQAVPPPRMNAGSADALRKKVKPFRMLPAAAKTRVALSICYPPVPIRIVPNKPPLHPNLEHGALFQHGLGAFKNRMPPPAKPAFPEFSSSRISSFTGFMTPGNKYDTEPKYTRLLLNPLWRLRHVYRSQYLSG